MASSSSMPTLPPPCPKSPPDYPDLYGRRRGAAKVQMLEREIGFLEVSFYGRFLLSLFPFYGAFVIYFLFICGCFLSSSWRKALDGEV